MGLDTTHECWNGPYSSFMRWRDKLAVVAGIPPLDFMEGYFKAGEVGSDPFVLLGLCDKTPNGTVNYLRERLPIKWESLREDKYLYFLLDHSDCDGDIPIDHLIPLAQRLKELLPNMDNWTEKTKQFIKGLKLAHKRKEKVEFY